MKTLLSIIVGFVAGIVVIFLIESLGHKMYPPPSDFDFNDQEALKLLIKNAPLVALLFVIFAWALGALTGGMIASWIEEKDKRKSALVVGVLLMSLGLLNLTMIPHPVWFWILGLAVYLPFAYLGFRISTMISK